MLWIKTGLRWIPRAPLYTIFCWIAINSPKCLTIRLLQLLSTQEATHLADHRVYDEQISKRLSEKTQVISVNLKLKRTIYVDFMPVVSILLFFCTKKHLDWLPVSSCHAKAHARQITIFCPGPPSQSSTFVYSLHTLLHEKIK